MMYAVDPDGVRVEAARGRVGLCPACGDALLAKCGEVKVWHWSHISRVDCDPWWEAETEWHRAWKLLAPPERVEVAMGEHRADVLSPDGAVVELQHSIIGPDEIRERERFYGKMVWLIDGGEFADHFRVEITASGAKFAWSPPRPSWLAARKPRFVHGFTVGAFVKAVNKHTGRLEACWRPMHRSDEVFQVLSIRGRPGVTGTGRIISREKFQARMISEQR